MFIECEPAHPTKHTFHVEHNIHNPTQNSRCPRCPDPHAPKCAACDHCSSGTCKSSPSGGLGGLNLSATRAMTPNNSTHNLAHRRGVDTDQNRRRATSTPRNINTGQHEHEARPTLAPIPCRASDISFHMKHTSHFEATHTPSNNDRVSTASTKQAPAAGHATRIRKSKVVGHQNWHPTTRKIAEIYPIIAI